MKNLARLLFKPRWQDKNPQVRRAAVTEARDAELVLALPQIARDDSDAAVRLAALKRIDDYETWRERSTGDADGQVRMAARAAYLALLCSDDARVPALLRRISELDTLSAAEIEDVATRARDRDLRAAALERVMRPSLLAERALADPDARLRATALERVPDVAALERIAERARKTDKLISRRARERAESLRIGSGDPRAIVEKAQMLCARADALLRSALARDMSACESIEGEWAKLGEAVPAELRQRFGATISLLHQIRAAPLTQSVAEAPASVHVEESATIIEPSGPAPALPTVDLLAAQAKVHASLAAATEAAKREREQYRARLREIEQLTEQYAGRLEAGDISAAHALHASIDRALVVLGDAPAALQSRLAPLHARYAELARWQRWSNDQRRHALGAEIESLQAAGLHPDALATRVREAREEWQRLDAAQASGSGDSALARRFNALCQRALKPARQYFDKRDAVRRSHAGEIETLLQTHAALPAEIVDWKAAASLRKQLGDALRGLDAVDPRERTALAKRLKDAIASLALRLDAHTAAIESARRRLIERAAALAQQAETRDAAREVRDLQREWTALGQGRRSLDQRQWNEFRQHCDAVFSKLDAARSERAAAESATRNQAAALLAQLDNLHRDASVMLEASQSELRALVTQWQSLSNSDRSIEQRFRKAHEAATRRLQDAARMQRLSRITLALDLFDSLREFERGVVSSAGVATRIEALPSAANPLMDALKARFTRSQSAASLAAEDAPARARLVELEFLASVETPQEDRELRMQYQLQRLASRMRERTAATPEAELTQILLAWFTQTAQTDELEQRFAHAARAAVSSLP